MLFCLVLAAMAGAAFYYEISKPGPTSEPQTIIIERGDSLGAVARRLKQSDAISSAMLFNWTARLMGAATDIRAGEFRLDAGLSVLETLQVIRFGEPVLRRITIPEGLTSGQVVRLLTSVDGLTEKIAVAPEEGSLLPETYYFSYGDSRRDVIRRMQQAQTELMDELWPKRAADLPFTTRLEALTLASIVEKETALGSERPLVASVFINRLRRGMRLQSDPTIIYGLTKGERLNRPILQSELQSETAFNTYRISGLPPHPIANPGRESIKAVLSPAETEYLYFVADGDGGHAFAKSLAEHNRNVSAWRRSRKAGNSNNPND